MEKLKNISPERLVYVDETGIDKYLYRQYAYAPRGQLVNGKISGKKYKRTNIIAGICQRAWIAPMIYSGTTDSMLFEHWFENCLLNEVETDSIIILDNATFHKKSVIPVLAQKKHCNVLFLPPYSPDLNPIEKKWACLKRRLLNILPDFDSFDFALDTCF